tara:strand:+ start:5940 stop:6320 length:381 start_codon:yes stop_codon:yes gene_type:complete
MGKLLIIDNSTTGKFLQGSLQKENYDVELKEDVGEAISHKDKNSIDIIIASLMSGGNEVEVIDSLYNLITNYNNSKIIITTNLAEAGIKTELTDREVYKEFTHLNTSDPKILSKIKEEVNKFYKKS